MAAGLGEVFVGMWAITDLTSPPPHRPRLGLGGIKAEGKAGGTQGCMMRPPIPPETEACSAGMVVSSGRRMNRGHWWGFDH